MDDTRKAVAFLRGRMARDRLISEGMGMVYGEPSKEWQAIKILCDNYEEQNMSDETKRRGGSRPGAGRPPTGRIKRDISLPPEVWALVEEYRKHTGIATTGEAVEQLVRLATSANR